MSGMADPSPSRGGGPFGIFRAIPDAINRIIREQLAKAQAELAKRWVAARPGVILTTTGVVLVLFGIGALVTSAITGLAQVLPQWLSALLIGAFLVIVALVLVAVGVDKLKKPPPGRE